MFNASLTRHPLARLANRRCKRQQERVLAAGMLRRLLKNLTVTPQDILWFGCHTPRWPLRTNHNSPWTNDSLCLFWLLGVFLPPSAVLGS